MPSDANPTPVRIPTSGTSTIAGARADEEDLAGDDLLDVDRCREHRVIDVHVAALVEAVEHAAEDAREEHAGRHHAGADELDIGDPVDLRDELAEAEAEREQHDRRLDDGREGVRAPEAL